MGTQKKGPAKAAENARGLTYLFEDKPEPAEIREVADGVYWLRLPLYEKLDHINVWLLEDGGSWVIVDTGLNNDRTKEIWETVFDKTFLGKPVSRVLVTHMHPDHIGLAGWMVDRFDVMLTMTRLEYLTCRVLVADTHREAPKEALDFMFRAGVPEEVVQGYKERFGTFGMSIYDLPQNFHRISHGDEIIINGREWRVVVGTGHSPEHACFYCPSLKLLISGDQVLPRISSHVGVFPNEPEANNLEDWIGSCKKLQDILPEDLLVLPSHNEPFYGVHNRLRALADGHEKRLEKLLSACRTPRSPSDPELFSILFKRPIGKGLFIMAISESMAHLNCLHRRGLVSKSLDVEGRWRFAADQAGMEG